jgi:hypothetical protein
MQFAVDDARIYWISTTPNANVKSRVRSCQKSDCPSTVVTYDEGDDIEPGDADHDSLAVGGGNVAWTTGSNSRAAIPTVTILVCPSTGCVGAPTVVASNVTLASLAIDETHAYWTSISDTAVLRRSLTGAGAPEALALNENGGAQLRLGETHAYWIGSPRKINGSVKRVLKQGGAPPEVVVTEQNQAAWLALDSTSFYWANSYLLGTISRCPLSGCVDAPAVIVGDQNRPSPIVTDGKSIFWMAVVDVTEPTSVRAAVMRCPVDGCASQMDTLAVHTVPNTGASMAIDESDVYWLVRRSVSSERGWTVQSTIYRHPK